MATTLVGSVTSALVSGAPWALRTRLFGGAVNGNTITTTIRGSEPEVPWQDGANGEVGWISGYLATPFTLSGTVTIGVRARESATSVNIGLRARVWKVPASVEDAPVLLGTFDRVGEIATSLTAYTWTGTPTSTPLKLNDRLLLRGFFYPQGGTIAAGTGDVRDQSNELFLELTENVTFSDTPVVVSPIRSVPILGQPRPLF